MGGIINAMNDIIKNTEITISMMSGMINKTKEF